MSLSLCGAAAGDSPIGGCAPAASTEVASDSGRCAWKEGCASHWELILWEWEDTYLRPAQPTTSRAPQCLATASPPARPSPHALLIHGQHCLQQRGNGNTRIRSKAATAAAAAAPLPPVPRLASPVMLVIEPSCAEAELQCAPHVPLIIPLVNTVHPTSHARVHRHQRELLDDGLRCPSIRNANNRDGGHVYLRAQLARAGAHGSLVNGQALPGSESHRLHSCAVGAHASYQRASSDPRQLSAYVPALRSAARAFAAPQLPSLW
ncbi:hypothetical protein HYPSUDRAFT_208177 [Hypholoma sublateritium FD-334 SS-4]|uniref:Uncharacterized protein n=1 Tax=Hypholoma sublateritium (strain FD-334 SS-4) TaxID=945553 RepID=A0A0D2N7E2_HYPSF|nr:hypothetical protein HYPSUDRAFT_208177 [Hypholoma sublateritium FD-334 SS-4]